MVINKYLAPVEEIYKHYGNKYLTIYNGYADESIYMYDVPECLNNELVQIVLDDVFKFQNYIDDYRTKYHIENFKIKHHNANMSSYTIIITKVVTQLEIPGRKLYRRISIEVDISDKLLLYTTSKTINIDFSDYSIESFHDSILSLCQPI